MASAATVALRSSNEATRQPGKAKRVTTNFVNSISADRDSTRDRQVQFLSARLALPVSVAGTIAALAWGVHHG